MPQYRCMSDITSLAGTDGPPLQVCRASAAAASQFVTGGLAFFAITQNHNNAPAAVTVTTPIISRFIAGFIH